MRTPEGPAFSDSQHEERGGHGPIGPLVNVDSHSEAPPNKQNNSLESLPPQPKKEIPDTLEDTKLIIFSATGSRDRARGAVKPAWISVLCILATYLAFVLIYDTVTEVPCRLPVLPQYFPHCTGHPIVTPDFVTLVHLQSKLGKVMEDTTRSSKVAVDIKDSEMALRDLRTLVTHSTLSNKDILGRDLKAFVEDAKAASGSLQQFGSRVWGAVDRVISLNEHTLITLESTPTGRGLAIAHQKGLEGIWLRGIELMDRTLQKLIHEAQANVGALQRLEEKLDTIEDMVSGEKEEIGRHERKLRQRWFEETLGMNNEKHQSHSASLELLTMVKEDRKSALKHVTEALLQLKGMSNDLDDLRDRVATPTIVTDIPIEAHIRNMRSGTEQLVNGQTRMREYEDEYRRRKFATG